jgi:hypothetical protein
MQSSLHIFQFVTQEKAGPHEISGIELQSVLIKAAGNSRN